MFDPALFKLPGMRRAATILGLLAIVEGICIVFQAYYLSVAIVGLWHLHSLASISQPMLWFALAWVGRQLLVVIKNRVMYPLVEQTTGDLRRKVMQKLYQLGPSYVAKTGTGNVVTTALEGIDKVQTYLMLVVIKVIDMMVIPWIILIYIAWLRWREALFLLAIFPLIILFMIILGYAAQAKADKQYVGYQRMSNHFVDTLRGLPTLKQLGLSKRYADNVYQVSEGYRKQTMAVIKIAMLSTFALDFFTTLSIAVVAVFLSFGLINGTITLLPALVILVLSPDYFLPLRTFANDYHATLNGKNAFADVQKMLALPVPTERQQLGTQPVQWQSDSTLSLHDVDFKYDDDQLALKHINIDVHGYQRIGIIGASGSGKSTLINLLGGFLTPVADQGKIQVNGQTVSHLSQDAWQQSFFYIPQNPYLFHATLAENIAFYQPDASRQAIERAAENAGLTAWIATLPAGLDTAIGEGSRGVSGGQAQRIALARAFLDDSRRVLLFDEPTAHLDIETEAELKTTILPVLDNHLVFFATHRLHWINQMDYVLVMDHGEIVEQGIPTELAAHDGAYVRLRDEMVGAI
ncbi:thiol reductant ABC exporter subunit CydD [Lactiplantibacillus plantarum]|uniref:thiol reductant ABC exporter subunit CydD n=1 Tax=Lactiplantibacillus plantarum TaxID=1590 RepID=UPI0024781212|nr:thiol reductant ABC exporter subunit CydD [Lactiplantibacillus plantarum]MDH7467286.1 thiol reductant ABC exporter subunit CydD [Lactiplantibacillus plantarum]MDN3215157.1 thiol reductant ABC exporter subunit CydD [Lactiplantibacillus plantarum]MDN3218282.1 thiol reductant ABC exporter subunit CydD [Lactiplantibacillus plantarum]